MGFWDKLFGKKNKTGEEPEKIQKSFHEGKNDVQKEEPQLDGDMVKPVIAAPVAAEKEETGVPVDRQDVTVLNPEQAADMTMEADMPQEQKAETADLHAENIQNVKNEKDIHIEDIQPPAEVERASACRENPVMAVEITSANVDAKLQKRLDAYFMRLREIYPDGVISHFNTGHKKLAERGAELRRLLEMDGDLDGFFAMGGFTYQRSNGGRPPLPLSAEDEKAVISRIKELFPDGVPVVMAVRDADHRLYLNLRALARRENRTVGDYLRENGCMGDRCVNEKEAVGV